MNAQGLTARHLKSLLWWAIFGACSCPFRVPSAGQTPVGYGELIPLRSWPKLKRLVPAARVLFFRVADVHTRQTLGRIQLTA